MMIVRQIDLIIFSHEMQFDDVDFCEAKLRRHSSSFVSIIEKELHFYLKEIFFLLRVHIKHVCIVLHIS
mgnify:CR=1 FL=1